MSLLSRMGLSVLTAFLIAVVIAPVTIALLRRLKFGQSILEIGPSWHKSKQGTPVMGGIIFIISSTVSFLVFSIKDLIAGDTDALFVLLTALLFGGIGFSDDIIKILNKRNLGLTSLQKIVLQALVSGALLFFLVLRGTGTAVAIPFVERPVELGFLYYILAFIMILGLVNSVNLTDGLDGLASCVTIPVMAFFALAAGGMGTIQSAPLSVLPSALVGGLLGFLVFNFYPARVFMGDTGSLFLGGMVAALAFVLDIPVFIVLAGMIYFIEAASVILQVMFYKLTRKRLFKMAPIHHHYEKKGYSEVRIVLSFTVVTIVVCALALYLLL